MTPLSTIPPWIVLAETLIPVWEAEISLVLVIPAVRNVLLTTTSADAEVLAAIDGILAANPENVKQYRSGKTGLLGFFVGQAMKAFGGKANPKVLNEAVKKRLDEIEL